jgi:hypothetical protein
VIANGSPAKPILSRQVSNHPGRKYVPNPHRARAGAPEERNRQPAERVAAGSSAVGCRPRFSNGAIVHGAHDLEEASRPALVDRAGLKRRELDAVARLGHDVVHEQFLHNLHDLANIVGREVTCRRGR